MVPVSDCPLSREKMAAAAAIDIEGRSSRATLLGGEGRERERERGPSVPKQGNFRGGGERREARTNETTAWLLDERERKRIAKGGGGGGGGGVA